MTQQTKRNTSHELSGERLKTVAKNRVTSALELAQPTEQEGKDRALWLSSSCFAVIIGGCRDMETVADAIEQAVQSTADSMPACALGVLGCGRAGRAAPANRR